MFKRSGKIGALIAVAVLLFTSCAAPKASMPTPDLNLVRTEAVVTALAQMTKQAALNPVPTQTPLVPTVQPFVTSTPIVITATTSIYGSGGIPSGGTSGGTGSSGATVPTWTPDVYVMQVIGTSHLDGYVCPTGEEPDYKVTLKNTGLVTWTTTHYYIKKLYDLQGTSASPVSLTKLNMSLLPVDTAPGGKVTFTIDILCPKFPSEKAWTTQWALYNDNGDRVGLFYFRFYTGPQPTHTPIKTRTPSPG